MAVSRGDLASPAPPALQREMPALAAAVDGLFEQVRSNLDDVQAMAMYDPVTALPNRVHFRREAERILGRARQRRWPCCSSTWTASRRSTTISATPRATRCWPWSPTASAPWSRPRCAASGAPLLARLAGDEFTMLLPDVSTRDEAERIAARALAALAEPFKSSAGSASSAARSESPSPPSTAPTSPA